MKKIIIAFNGNCYPKAALEFALQLNKTEPVLLTGVFIPQATYAYLWNPSPTLTGPMLPPLVEEVSDESAEINKKKFQSFCEENKIEYTVHNDIYNFVLPELVKETRFADLLLVEIGNFFDSTSKTENIEQLKNLLNETECPVIVVPGEFDFPKKNIIAYDGSESSVYALKQFSYLFPEFSKNETLLVYSKNENDAELPSEKLVEELGNQHYENFSLLKLNMEPKKYFSTWLGEEKSAILITGSYGRSRISQLLAKSFLEEVFLENELPIFITHT